MADLKQVENQIETEIDARDYNVDVHKDWHTPKGNRRSSPMYECTISNRWLRASKTLKSACRSTLEDRISKQITSWAKQELKQRLNEAREELEADADSADEDAKELLEELRAILKFTLDFDDRVNWDEMHDNSKFKEFSFGEPPTLELPKKPFFAFLPFVRNKWIGTCEDLTDQHKAAVDAHNQERHTARDKYEKSKERFLKKQMNSNVQIRDFKSRYEAGQNEATVEYLNLVFERSEYPECIALDYSLTYDEELKSVQIEVQVPKQSDLPDVDGYKFTKSSGKLTPIKMKKKAHDDLYKTVIRQIAIRTLHEVYEADYTKNVLNATVTLTVDEVCKATGNDKVNNVATVQSKRDEFEAIKLDRVDADSCFERLEVKQEKKKAANRSSKKSKAIELSGDDLIVSIDGNKSSTPDKSFLEFVERVDGLAERMFAGAEFSSRSEDEGARTLDFTVEDDDPVRGGKFLFFATYANDPVPKSVLESVYRQLTEQGAVKAFVIAKEFAGGCSAYGRNKPLSLIDNKSLGDLEEKMFQKKAA